MTSKPFTPAAAPSGSTVARSNYENDTVRATYKPLTDLQKEQMATVKSCGQELIDIIAAIGPGRETALAKTKAEEAVMWATKAITALGSIK